MGGSRLAESSFVDFRLAESPTVGSRFAESPSLSSHFAESPSLVSRFSKSSFVEEGASADAFLCDRDFFLEVPLVRAPDLVASFSCSSDCASNRLAGWIGVASSTSKAAKAFAVCGRVKEKGVCTI